MKLITTLSLLLSLSSLSAHAQDKLDIDCAEDAKNGTIALDEVNNGEGNQQSYSVIEMKDKEHSAKFEVTIFDPQRTYYVELSKIIKGADDSGFIYKCVVEKIKRKRTGSD
ncbi:MAG: hypothetical protein KA715_11405 [Xanthomonadaceae bacterium]|nr:hypothetical protein [Xanthomonadaceae bacterium]